MNLIVSAIGQGLLWALLGLGLYLTFRILNLADMTVEGTFPLGAAVAVTAITHGFSPLAATLLAFGAGMLAGPLILLTCALWVSRTSHCWAKRRFFLDRL